MKKVVMFALAALATVVVNAASVNWGAGTVTDPDGNVANKSVTGYLFVIDSDTYATLGSSEAIWNAYGSKLGQAYTTGTTSKKGALILTDDSKEYGAGEKAYAAIIYTYGEGDNMKYIASAGVATFESSMDVDMDGMAAGSWANASDGGVPEPTSALLLLVGGAMLALRRKQK